MTARTIEDRLRQEYFDFLPEIRRVVWQLETEIRYYTLSVRRKLEPYKHLEIRSRVKEFESAVNTLRRKQEGNVFQPEREYSILDLRDLAGVRVLVFPNDKLSKVDREIQQHEPFKDWKSDPVKYARGYAQTPKYYGTCADVSSRVLGEYQVVPMLIGRFWEVEHSAIYKPAGWAKGADRDHDLKNLRTKVEVALSRFEQKFEEFVKRNSKRPSD